MGSTPIPGLVYMNPLPIRRNPRAYLRLNLDSAARGPKNGSAACPP